MRRIDWGVQSPRCGAGGYGIMQKVLIIEDEKPIGDLLKYALEQEGFSAITAWTGKAGLEAIAVEAPGVILLDLMLPDMDGLEICRQVTAERNIPILIISAKNDQLDKLIGLEYGADDYITKPFDVREVVLRVKSILRRISRAREKGDQVEALTCGEVTLYPNRHEVYSGGEPVELTPKEFALLETLMRNRGTVLSRAELVERVWEFEYVGDTRTVDIHVQRLRKKLRNDKFIATVFGLGYKIPEDAGTGV